MDRNHIFCSFLKGVFLIPQAAYSRKMVFLLRVIVTKQILAALFLCMGSVAAGGVSTRVCRADGNTPLEYTDIMVGTRLTMIVSSNVAEYWWGGALLIEGEDMQNRGVLYGRGYDGENYAGSCLPDAGVNAAVWSTVFPGHGFELYGGEEPNAGDWFILDYNAIDIGDCNVAFYDWDISDTEPVDILPFHHVRTRDFDNNTRVDFADFAILALYWQETDCNDPNWCEGTDLDTDGNVDSNDLRLFSDYWLETTQ